MAAYNNHFLFSFLLQSFVLIFQAVSVGCIISHPYNHPFDSKVYIAQSRTSSNSSLHPPKKKTNSIDTHKIICSKIMAAYHQFLQQIMVIFWYSLLLIPAIQNHPRHQYAAVVVQAAPHARAGAHRLIRPIQYRIPQQLNTATISTICPAVVATSEASSSASPVTTSTSSSIPYSAVPLPSVVFNNGGERIMPHMPTMEIEFGGMRPVG